MRQGLQSSSSGLQLGLSPSDCTPASAETASSVGTAVFSAAAADWETQSTVTGFLPEFIWLCQELSGGRVLDSLNDVPLAQKLLFGSTLAMGVATELEGGARTAVRLADGTGQGLVAADQDVLSPYDHTAEVARSVGWLVFFKAADDPATRALASYGEAINGTPVDEKSGIMTTLDSSGRAGASFSDGTNAKGGSLIGTDLCDGTFHVAGTFYNSVNGDCITVHDSGQHTRNLAAATALTWPEMVSYFTIGQGRLQSPGMDVACILGFEGASAELSSADYLTAVSAIHDAALASI